MLSQEHMLTFDPELESLERELWDLHTLQDNYSSKHKAVQNGAIPLLGRSCLVLNREYLH